MRQRRFTLVRCHTEFVQTETVWSSPEHLRYILARISISRLWRTRMRVRGVKWTLQYYYTFVSQRISDPPQISRRSD